MALLLSENIDDDNIKYGSCETTSDVSSSLELLESDTSSVSTLRCKSSRKEKSIITLQQVGGLLQIDTGGRNLKKSQLSQLQQIISGKQPSVKTNEDGPSKQQQIQDFMAKYRKSPCLADVTVTKMRHIIPILLMDAYPALYGSYSCKVKGLWEKKPEDWPDRAPFVDPNNKIKSVQDGSGRKPTKELLLPMLEHLVKKQLEKENISVGVRNESSVTRRLSGRKSDPMLAQPSIVLPSYADEFQEASNAVSFLESEMDDSIDGTAYTQHNEEYSSTDTSSLGLISMTSYCANASDDMTVDLDMRSSDDNVLCGSGMLRTRGTGYAVAESSGNVAATNDFMVTGAGLDFWPPTPTNRLDDEDGIMVDVQRSRCVAVSDTAEPGSIPRQVEDSEEVDIYRWQDPVKDLMRRIKLKIEHLVKLKNLPSDVQPLLDAYGILVRIKDECTHTQDDKVAVIEKAHILETVVDVVKLSNTLPNTWRTKLHNYQVDWTSSYLAASETRVQEFYQVPSDGHECNSTPISLHEHNSRQELNHVVTARAGEDDLVSVLNIEKRETHFGNLLTTMPNVEVRPNVGDNYAAETNEKEEKLYFPVDELSAGLQETGDGGVMAWDHGPVEVVESPTDLKLEINLEDLIRDGENVAPLIAVLDQEMFAKCLDKIELESNAGWQDGATETSESDMLDLLLENVPAVPKLGGLSSMQETKMKNVVDLQSLALPSSIDSSHGKPPLNVEKTVSFSQCNPAGPKQSMPFYPQHQTPFTFTGQQPAFSQQFKPNTVLPEKSNPLGPATGLVLPSASSSSQQCFAFPVAPQSLLRESYVTKPGNFGAFSYQSPAMSVAPFVQKSEPQVARQTSIPLSVTTFSPGKSRADSRLQSGAIQVSSSGDIPAFHRQLQLSSEFASTGSVVYSLADGILYQHPAPTMLRSNVKQNVPLLSGDKVAERCSRELPKLVACAELEQDDLTAVSLSVEQLPRPFQQLTIAGVTVGKPVQVNGAGVGKPMQVNGAVASKPLLHSLLNEPPELLSRRQSTSSQMSDSESSSSAGKRIAPIPLMVLDERWSLDDSCSAPSAKKGRPTSVRR